MTARIERVIAHLCEINVGFTYSSGTMDVGRAIVWEIVAGKHVGLGECQARGSHATPGLELGGGRGKGFADDYKKVLEDVAGPLIGGDPARLEVLLPELPPIRDRDARVAREGLSIALYDLAGRMHGVPVHCLLGGRRRDRVPGMPVIHVAPPQVMARRSKAWAEGGYRHVKVKFRGDLETDVEAVRAIRAAVGQGVEIVVDANDGYKDLDMAGRAIRALAPCGVGYFEDMLAAPLERIAELRRTTGARIMVDNQASWPGVAEVVRLQAADVVNHHPNNQGGLAAALGINAVARVAGIETAIGSSGLLGIQDAAFQMLSSVIAMTRPCEDIGIMPYYEGPTRGQYAFDRAPTVVKESYPIVDGVIHIPDRPGLGIEMDRTRLDDLCRDRIDL